jgi:hypothetical protein
LSLRDEKSVPRDPGLLLGAGTIGAHAGGVGLDCGEPRLCGPHLCLGCIELEQRALAFCRERLGVTTEGSGVSRAFRSTRGHHHEADAGCHEERDGAPAESVQEAAQGRGPYH